jgi:pyridoxal 5'-phosphate synthase pdxS subunit
VRHLRALRAAIRRLQTLADEELVHEGKTLGAPLPLLRVVARTGKLPVPNFAAGGVATPADAALCMALGAESVFVGSGIFLSQDPARRASAIVDAVTYWNDPQKLAAVSADLGEPMRGTEIAALPEDQRYAAGGI